MHSHRYLPGLCEVGPCCYPSFPREETETLTGVLICLKIHTLVEERGFPGASGKDPTRQCRRHERRRFCPRVATTPWGRAWRPTPVFLPGKSQGQRSLEGYGPWGGRESDLSFHDTHSAFHRGPLATTVLPFLVPSFSPGVAPPVDSSHAFYFCPGCFQRGRV